MLPNRRVDPLPLLLLVSDEFTDPILAGSLSGTFSQPGKNLRLVTDTYAITELITNPGYETAGAGAPDVFASWSETGTWGTSLIERVGDSVHGGSWACKITRGDTYIQVANSFTVVPGQIYNLAYWTRGDGTNAGRYQVWDSTHAAGITAMLTTGVTGAAYQQNTLSFTVPAGCVTASIIFSASSTSTAYAYFDDVSVIPVGAISTIGGVLNFAGGSTANDGIWYPLLPRIAGRTFLARIIPSDTAGVINVGWDANQSGAITDALQFAASGVLNVISNGAAAQAVGAYTATTYDVALVLKGTGCRWFILGGAFTTWTLLFESATGTGDMYPAVAAGSTTSVFTIDNIKVPLLTWVPRPAVSDSLNRADGALGTTDGYGSAERNGGGGLTWSHDTWTIASAVAINTPVPGTDVVAANSSFAAWTGDNPDSWTVTGESGTDPEISEVGTGEGHGGAGTGYCNMYSSAGTLVHVSQGTTVQHTWYQATVDIDKVTAGGIKIGTSLSAIDSLGALTTVGSKVVAGRCTAGSGLGAYVLRNSGATDVTFRNVTLKPLVLKELISGVVSTTPDCAVSADITRVALLPCGLVLRLDSRTIPANFVIVYIGSSGGYILVDQCLAGVYSALLTQTAITYAAYATLTCKLNGNSLDVYYNGLKVGGTLTMNAGLAGNTLMGKFSTHPTNLFKNFTIFARGASNEYAGLSTL